MTKIKKEYDAIVALSQETKKHFIIAVFNSKEEAEAVNKMFIEAKFDTEVINGLHSILKTCTDYNKKKVKTFINPKF